MIKEENEIDFKDYFVVDPSSPTGLRWRDDVNDGITGRGKNTHAGQPAGVKRIIKNRTDSMVVSVKCKIYMLNRVVWEMVNGPIPEGYIIDHLDGNPLNNKIENLACKTRGENMQNRKIDSRNNTGFPGVSRSEKNGNLVFVAVYSDHNMKSKNKRFPVSKYGEDAFRLACEWRVENLKRLNNEYGLKYTDRHLIGGV